MNRCVPLLVLLILPLYILGFLSFPENVQADHYQFAKDKKVLVVASYHKEYKWCHDIIEALEHELAGAELTVFYMDTKRNLAGAEEKAKEAFALYLKLQPDAVITVDDNAQAYFVVPYLKDKVETPVIFCGVNDDASKYGFPTNNITGVVEKKHYRESISFAQIIKPSVHAIAVLYHPGTSNSVNLAQIEKEKGRYTANIFATIAVNTVAEVQKALVEYAENVDAFMLFNMTGIIGKNNNKLEGHEAIALISELTDKVTIGASDWEVEAGALCGVIKSGEEQGVLAALQLIQHWKGKAIRDIPLRQNENGLRYLNLSTLKRLQIQLKPEMIIGSKIISGK